MQCVSIALHSHLQTLLQHERHSPPVELPECEVAVVAGLKRKFRSLYDFNQK